MDKQVDLVPGDELHAEQVMGDDDRSARDTQRARAPGTGDILPAPELPAVKSGMVVRGQGLETSTFRSTSRGLYRKSVTRSLPPGPRTRKASTPAPPDNWSALSK